MQEGLLYMMRYEVEPLPGIDNFVHYAGAFANVWADASSERQAVGIAAREVQMPVGESWLWRWFTQPFGAITKTMILALSISSKR